MKLIVQIPCYNEAATLAETLADIPREIAGVGTVEILIVDDGSSDGTAEVAREHGADHVVRHAHNRGLAHAFRTGLDACLERGADIVVNTDADNQYAGADIPRLIAPILDGKADIVVGDRGTFSNPHFSFQKKCLQYFGSALVRRLSGTTVPDAVSGFRAISREAAMQTNIVSSFSYTIEMLIQAGSKRLCVASVPVRTNPKTRPSRLFRNVPHFLRRSGATIVRMYAMYRPLRVFFMISMALIVAGVLPILRFLWFFVSGDGAGHTQSLVLGGALVSIGFVTLMTGMVADLIGFNRMLIEIALQRLARIELELGGQSRAQGAAAAHDDTVEAVERARDELARLDARRGAEPRRSGGAP